MIPLGADNTTNQYYYQKPPKRSDSGEEKAGSCYLTLWRRLENWLSPSQARTLAVLAPASQPATQLSAALART